MTEQYLMRWTCENCKKMVEGKGYDDGMPGWREVRTFSYGEPDEKTGEPEVVVKTEHFCSVACEQGQVPIAAAENSM